MRTMATAGRAVVFSGTAVAIGLALLLFMPLPFMVSIGVGGFLIPLVSIVAAITLQPVLLSCSLARAAASTSPTSCASRCACPSPASRARRTPTGASGPGSRARSCAGRSLPRARCHRPRRRGRAGARPAARTRGRPRASPQPESIRGFNVLREAVGPGAPRRRRCSSDTGRPAESATGGRRRDRAADRGGRATPRSRACDFEPRAALRGRHGAVRLRQRRRTARIRGARGAGLRRRLRDDLIPAARFPRVDGARRRRPAQGIDFIDSAYGAFPWLVLAVLILTYVT